MTLGLHLLLYWQAKHSLPYLKFKLSNPKVQFNLFLAEFIWLTSWSSFSCEEEVPDSAMNGDTTWTLCTETDGDRFVSDLPAPSSAEAILMLSGDQPTRQYSIFLANTSHYWLIWMRLTVNSLGLMGWRTSFYMHFAHPGEKDFHLTQGCLLPFCNIERRNGGADTSVYITCMNMISSFAYFPKQSGHGWGLFVIHIRFGEHAKLALISSSWLHFKQLLGLSCALISGNVPVLKTFSFGIRLSRRLCFALSIDFSFMKQSAVTGA